MRRAVAIGLFVAASCASYGDNTPAQDAGGDDGGADAAPPPPPPEDDAHAPTATTALITTAHRFVPGAMFGGWGPHLGHLLRRAAPPELWFADDACDTVDTCDVNVDKRIDYLRFDPAANAWTKVSSRPLPATVQQNTASLLAGDTIYTYGVDIASTKLVECTFALGTLVSACAPLPVVVDANANYVGAALAPSGARIVWLTNVKDGGGGAFQWFANYGGGWNGPRTGPVGGYNDASYIHVAFGSGASANEMTLHAELVSGLAPNWTFLGAVGAVDVSTTNAATWANSLVPANASDPVISTDDVAIDPVTNDAHLFARTNKGDALYFHRPAGGTWSAALSTFASTYRVRLVVASDGTLFLAYGPTDKGLAWRASPAGSRTAGAPIDWSKLAEHTVSLPFGYAAIQAIYPESSIYQSTPVTGLRVAIVGAERQAEALFVSIDP
jgi:hypothetical protein